MELQLGRHFKKMLVSGSSSDRHQPAINEYFNRTLMVVGESVFDQTQSMIEQFTITVGRFNF